MADNIITPQDAWIGINDVVGQYGGDFSKVPDAKVKELANYLNILNGDVWPTNTYVKLIQQQNAGAKLDFALIGQFLATNVPQIPLPEGTELPQGNPFLSNIEGFVVFMSMYLSLMAEKQQKAKLVPLIKNTMKMMIEYAQEQADAIMESAKAQSDMEMMQAITSFAQAGASAATFVAGLAQIKSVYSEIKTQTDNINVKLSATDERLQAEGLDFRVFTEEPPKKGQAGIVLDDETIRKNVAKAQKYSGKQVGEKFPEDTKAEVLKLLTKGMDDVKTRADIKTSAMHKLHQNLFMFSSFQEVSSKTGEGVSRMYNSFMDMIKGKADAQRAWFEQLSRMEGNLLDQLFQAFSTSKDDANKAKQALDEWMNTAARYTMGIQA